MAQICEPDMRKNNKKPHIFCLTLAAQLEQASMHNEDRVPVRDATFKVTIINLFDHETVTCQLRFTTSKSILLNKVPFSSQ